MIPSLERMYVFSMLNRENSELHFLLPELCVAMLNGSIVTAAWCVLRLRMEETASRYGG
jgi:hypothetical protein